MTTETTKDRAYRIIRIENKMIQNTNRPIKTTIRWLEEAIDLLKKEQRAELLPEHEHITAIDEDIKAACEIIEAMKKASFPEMRALLGYTGRATARILTDARSRELIKLVDGFYYITSR